MKCYLFRTVVAAVFAAVVGSGPALAQLTIQPGDLPALFPGVEIKPSEPNPGWMVLETFREPEVSITPGRVRAQMTWNGIDDDEWPFTRIVDVLLGKACGPVRSGWTSAQQDRLYASRSVTRERNMGGNAGTSFSKRISASVGRCRVDLAAQGARWHGIEATIVPLAVKR